MEWLRICYCQGWLGSPKRNHGRTTRSFRDRGERIQGKLANIRVRIGVAAPYGDKAEQLGLGQRTPPSHRRRGAPPGQTTLDISDS